MDQFEEFFVEVQRVCPGAADGRAVLNERLPNLSFRDRIELLRALPDNAGVAAVLAAWRAFAAANPSAIVSAEETNGFDYWIAGGEDDDSWTVVGPPPAPITIDDFYRALILSGEPVRRARQIAADFEPDIDRPGAIWMGDALLYVALLSSEHEERIRDYLEIDQARMAQELERLRAGIAAREANPEAPVVENYYDYETGTWVTPETRFRDFVSQPKFASLDTLISADPERAWPLLLDLVANVPDDLLYLAGEGPVSIFLREQGVALIDRIDAQARTSDRFRSCLGESDIPSEISERLFAARRREQWPPAHVPGTAP